MHNMRTVISPVFCVLLRLSSVVEQLYLRGANGPTVAMESENSAKEFSDASVSGHSCHNHAVYIFHMANVLFTG